MKKFKMIFICIFIISLTSCQKTDNNLNNDITNYFSYTRKTNNEHEKNIDVIEKREEKLSEEVKRMIGVDKATVEITGNKAVVWITISKGINDDEIIVLKEKIQKHIKIIDKQIENVTVSVSPELISRINDMVEIY